MLGYELRNTPNIIEGGWDMAFNINRPKRLSFNEWVELAKQLSGIKDVSQMDMSDDQIQEAFADSYAAAECSEGWHRQQHPNDPTET